jgi:hypothetical protein
MLAERPGNHRSESGRVAVLEVVGAVDRGQRIDRKGKRLGLRLDLVLPEELDRAIRGAMDADLRAAEKSEAILQPDLRAAVQTEEVLGKLSEVAITERTCEAVRHAESAPVPRHAQCRGERHQREVRLDQADVQIGIVLRCLRCLRSSGRRGGKNQNEDRTRAS